MSTKRPLVFGSVIKAFRQPFRNSQTSNLNGLRKTQPTRPLILRSLRGTIIGQQELPEGIER